MLGFGKILALGIVAVVGSASALLGLALMHSEGNALAGTDYGLDTNGNGLFDFLVVKVSYPSDDSGYYTVVAALMGDSDASQDCLGGYDIGGTKLSGLPVSHAYVSVFLEQGDNEIKLAFAGKEVYRGGIGGPYTVLILAMPNSWFGNYPGGSMGDWGMDSGGDPYGSNARWSMPEPKFYTTNPYKYIDFEPATSAIEFTADISDAGIDTDSNGLFDYLEVSSQVEVNLAGHYSLSAMLYKQLSTGSNWMMEPMYPMLVLYSYDYSDLETGSQTVSLRFNGGDIRYYETDGPYQLMFTAYYYGDYYYNHTDPYRGGLGSVIPPIYPGGMTSSTFDFYYDMACRQTGAYKYTDFEEYVPSIVFVGSYSDQGIDSDGNGLYEELKVDVGVSVLNSGEYMATGILYSSDASIPISFAYDRATLTEGPQSITLTFDGGSINASGLDGSYLVNVTVMDTSFMVPMGPPSMISTSFHTKTYTHDQFEGYPFWNGTRGVWISNVGVTSSGDPPNLTGAATVTVTRGDDMLTVVYDDAVYLVITDSSGQQVFEGATYIEIPSGGMDATASFTFTLPAHREYTATAYLTSIDHPTNAMQVAFTA